MKQYIIISFLAVLTLFAGCTKGDKEDVTQISINAAGEYFINGEAELILSLSEAVEITVNFELQVSGDIPEENLEFKKTQIIPAGTSVVTVPVSVSTEGLEEGEYKAIFSIYTAVGANLSPDKRQTTVLLNVISAE